VLRRSTHSVELTMAGSALLDRARKLLGDLDEAIATTQSVGGELANRMASLWAPVVEVTAAGRDIQERRTAYEDFLAQAELPDGVAVRPVNAGGVSSLAVSPRDQPETAVLFLHGGGYAVGSAYGYRPLVGALVAAAGVGAIVPDYRLAPEHPYPAALEDALSAYRWLAEQLGSTGIVLAGDSVGAHLACSLMLTLRAQGLPQPAGAVLLSPGVDLTGESLVQLEEQELAVFRSTVEAYLGGHPADDPIVNPLRADLTGLPPLLAQSATGDFVVREAELLVERAETHGVDARLEVYPADTHVFHIFWSFLPEAADALQSAGRFIRGQLAGEPVLRRAE
jgi:acetyl esterase/lipase